MALQIRRGPTVDREGITPLVGELIYDTDSKGLFIGDGVTPGGTGVSGYTNEEIQDLAAALFTSGVHTGGITFVYNNSQNRIDVAVAAQLEADLAPKLGANLDLNSKDITGTGNINIDGSITANYIDAKGNLSGSIYSDSSTLLIDGTEGTIVLDGTIAGHVVPKANISYDLGSADYRFRDLYLSGSSIKLGDATITSTLTRVNLPAGSTVGGLSIVTGTLGNSIVADLKGSVFGDDSVVLVDGVNNILSNGHVSINSNEITSNITSPRLGYAVKIGSQTAIAGTSLLVTSTGGQPSIAFDTVANSDLAIISKMSVVGYGSSYASPTRLNAGDYISGYGSSAFEPSTSSELPSGLLLFRVDNNGTINSEVANGKVEILTTSGTSTGTLSIKYLTFDSKGWLGVNQQDAQATVDINGFMKLAILTAAPTSPANGMVAIADGTTWNPLSNGKQSMVVYLGGGWRELAVAP